MTIKIIGAGYGRTGTMSTQIALNKLGFPCYHMFEVIENKKNKNHIDFWLKVAKSPAFQQHDWQQVFANYTATIDNPSSCVWQEQMAAYPNAKVILTLHPRGAKAWYESTIDTIYTPQIAWQFKVLEFFIPFARKMGEMTDKLIWQRNHKSTMNDKVAAIAEYHKHIELVKELVPADKLLVFSADQGWGPLCEFLGVDAPNEDFPRVNDKSEIKAKFAKAKIAAYVLLLSAILVSAGIIIALNNLVGLSF